jgi:4-amino-4-deoxy-L-arabinose transferase-like glycosyltransferase
MSRPASKRRKQALERKSDVPSSHKMSAQRPIPFHWRVGALIIIVLLAALLRLVALDSTPPAIHADEAPNAWNAYTLLNTGTDQYGVSWPIFYIRAFGDYRTTSYAYALLPFQSLGGMNVWTTRLPAAITGIFSVLLLYFVAARFFGFPTALMAAAMLALNPWHLQTSRWGHEASLSPFLVLLSIAALLWANLPLDNQERRPRPIVAGVAGAIIAASCYGYSAVRAFLPCFMIGLLAVTWPAWRKALKSRDGIYAVAAFVVAGMLLFGPLLWSHLTDPEIGERARILGWVWHESESPIERAVKIIARYLDHYSLDFLFLNGDRDPALSPPAGFGLFHWYDLVFMSVGLVALIRGSKTGAAARIVLVWLALYPVGDILFPHVSSHSLRSLAGVSCLVLISAFGAVQAGRRLWSVRQKNIRIGLAAGALLIVLISHGYFVHGYFGAEFRQHKSSLIVFGADILEAATWLKPRLQDFAAVFITGQAAHSDIVTLVGLEYEPQQWFREARDLVRGPLPDGKFANAYVYLRYGKIYFLLTEASITALNQLAQNDRPDRVILIVRPGELGLERHARPVHVIHQSDGQATLWIFDLEI